MRMPSVYGWGLIGAFVESPSPPYLLPRWLIGLRLLKGDFELHLRQGDYAEPDGDLEA